MFGLRLLNFIKMVRDKNCMVKDKKGMEYYYIIFSLIIGLILLGIFFLWLYQEYFTEDDVDLQICRQSVEARAAIPSISKYGSNYLSLKGDYPLKCKTQVITIDYEDVPKLEREIANTIAGCWNLFGEGKKDIFPTKVLRRTSVCVPCARIHISPRVRDYYSDKEIIISRALELPYRDRNYLAYLNDGDGPFGAFTSGNARDFNINGPTFRVDNEDKTDGVFYNRITDVTGGDFFDLVNIAVSRVDLPREFDPEKGDLVVFYGHVVSNNGGDGSPGGDGVGHYFPYIIYTHSKDNYMAEFDNMFVDGFLWKNTDFCVMQEGIPA